MAKAATETTTKTAADMAEVRTPDHLLRRRIGRTIGRGVWEAGYRAEFPDASKEERKAAWEEARKDFTKVGLRALKTLEKTGYEVVQKDGV